MNISDNPFIREIKRDANGHFLIFVHPENSKGLSYFFFQNGIKGHYKEDRYKTQNILEIFDEETRRIYINCHRVLPDALKDELRIVVASLLCESEATEDDVQGFTQAHFTIDFVNGLTEWFGTVHKAIGYPAFPKRDISRLFYDVFEIIIPPGKRQYEAKTPLQFKPIYIQSIVDGQTNKIRYPQIDQFVGKAYATLIQFEKTYTELEGYSLSSRAKK